MSSPLRMYPSDSSTASKQIKHSSRHFHCRPSPPKLPTFHNDQGSTRPFYLFPLFLLINIVTMADRAIIPGASQEFLGFLGSAVDAPEVVRENPDAGLVRYWYLMCMIWYWLFVLCFELANCAHHLTIHYPQGILQAAFMIGYTIAIILSGHYVHKIKWKPLVFSTLCVWWLGVLGSGNAKQYNSFYVLLFSRMATGCAEAAFQVVAPPLIQDRAGGRAGFWLSVFLAGLPLGLSVGYI